MTIQRPSGVHEGEAAASQNQVLISHIYAIRPLWVRTTTKPPLVQHTAAGSSLNKLADINEGQRVRCTPLGPFSLVSTQNDARTVKRTKLDLFFGPGGEDIRAYRKVKEPAGGFLLLC